MNLKVECKKILSCDLYVNHLPLNIKASQYYYQMMEIPDRTRDGSGCQSPVPTCPVAGRDRPSKSRLGPSRGKFLSLPRCPFVPGQ